MKKRTMLPLLGLGLMSSMAFAEPPRRKRDDKVYSPSFSSKIYGVGPLSQNKKIRKGAGKRMSRAERKRYYGKQHKETL